MIRLVGLQAHSEFRLSQIFQQLCAFIPKLSGLTSRHEYFLQCTEDLTASEFTLLMEVLEVKEPTEEISPCAFWVVPRFGTQSAWGSKAVDILHHVGLTKVERIERAVVYQFDFKQALISTIDFNPILPILYDKMTETIVSQWEEIAALFTQHAPLPLQEISILEQGLSALTLANTQMGLALSQEEIQYLYTQYQELQRNPTDVELMMFAQANSEHCRHKIFKAHWEIDGIRKEDSLFGMIQYTYQCTSEGILSAYHDNAAVVKGFGMQRFYCDPMDNIYKNHTQNVHLLMKVETHNHPTAIEPFAGAGTGQGGEIRDEGATGCGSKPKAGLTGFTVSHLHIPGWIQPWEENQYLPSRIASPLEIMLKGPIGGAAFNNEFGRVNLCGYFRTFLHTIEDNEGAYCAFGYHKPVMLAGGMGNIAENHIKKKPITDGAFIVVLGGPALKIGLGGGAASSMDSGASHEALDFASVQRQNPEMERRCQEVIDRCWALDLNNPILSIHDVGAGGLANAIPELVYDAGLGASLDLRKIPNAESQMSPLEIWCNESQERYVLAIHPHRLAQFTAIAERERCLYAVLGHATLKPHLKVYDEVFDNQCIDIPQSLLFGNTPKVFKQVNTRSLPHDVIKTDEIPLAEMIERILHHPTVADKSFLITIGDRTVGGLVARDQMVGPWQVPVADCAVTATHYAGTTGEAMSMGERSPIALLSPRASARMAVSEAILNILAADVAKLSDIRLSCNWMAAANEPGQEADLFAAVEAVGKHLCPSWGITIPVGKDSLSMRTTWAKEREHKVVSPVTLVVSAFAPVNACRKTLTPELNQEEETLLLLVDLAEGKKRLGGSIFAQVTKQLGNAPADIDTPEIMKSFVKVLNELKAQNQILAYHDRSDGGLWVTLCEMAFATHCGLTIDLDTYIENWQKEGVAALFNEEAGVVIQIKVQNKEKIKALFAEQGLISIHEIATINQQNTIEIYFKGTLYFSEKRNALHAKWSKTSYFMQKLRDNPAMAEEAYAKIQECADPRLILKWEPNAKPQKRVYEKRPKVAILREQGVNGHIEMAAAFTLAGFEAEDVTMSDLLAGKTLAPYAVLAVCGGFSYGDVLGAGQGWAKTILYQSRLRQEFSAFFAREDTLTLGVCNGCQMLSSLSELIPGADDWPVFLRNRSEQFEARLSLVEVCRSPSILLKGMQGAILPIAVAHGEGRVAFRDSSKNASRQNNHQLISLRYVDSKGKPTESYPDNPNGSPLGTTGLTTRDGRVTIMMPHPERVFKTWQFSWHPKEWEEESPWMTLFHNAYNWLR